jgi:exopolyphosphatase/guanosine-5'-triphosphate,3'-diphosphate pyrophosphatase
VTTRKRPRTSGASRGASSRTPPGASKSAPKSASKSAPKSAQLRGKATGPRPTRIAAIDIGSNSVRQIVADVSTSGRIRVLDEMKAMPRLGDGMVRTGRLSEEAMDGAAAAIGRMVTLAKQLRAERVEIVATSAVRDAANSFEFTERIEAETGHRVRILSGDEEAVLCFRSALAHFDLGTGRSIAADIGGGSLELVLAKDGLIERVASLPFGAVRLTNQFLSDSTRRRNVNALRAHVRDGLRRAMPVKDWRNAQIIGSGGTFTNLAGILLARQRVTVPSVHGTRITRADVEHVLEWLQALTPEERLLVPGLNPARADIIVAGLAVVAEVMARFDPPQLLASGYGIREGLLLEAARVTPRLADPGKARERSVIEFAERCHYEEGHAHQVRRLALHLFDSLGVRMGLERSDRQLLADAALLHDVGYHINYEKHHKHSFHLISHAELLGMTPADQVVIAHVARYHRGAPPKLKHGQFGALDRSLREKIVKLAALLRFADGMDRGHVSAVEGFRIRWLTDTVRVTVSARADAPNIRLECWGASRKRQLLESLVGRPIQVVDPNGDIITADDSGDD